MYKTAAIVTFLTLLRGWGGWSSIFVPQSKGILYFILVFFYFISLKNPALRFLGKFVIDKSRHIEMQIGRNSCPHAPPWNPAAPSIKNKERQEDSSLEPCFLTLRCGVIRVSQQATGYVPSYCVADTSRDKQGLSVFSPQQSVYFNQLQDLG